MKTKVLFYCTKGTLWKLINVECKNYNYYDLVKDNSDKCLNGKIVCECEVECESFEWWSNSRYDDGYFSKDGGNITKELCKKSCLTYEQLFDYIGGRDNGYALHISNLKVFDEQLELGKVKANIVSEETYDFKELKKAPQNMMWVWYKGEKYCLISIRPEWLYRILNGEKTIEIRKKILKGMM